MENIFTAKIKGVLKKNFSDLYDDIFEQSDIIKYLNFKMKSANRGSKSRSSFANIYAVYVLIEGYVNKGFVENKAYKNYEGAIYSELFKRQRELPFGQKLQNHALNNRMNAEFAKYFPSNPLIPILRDLETNKYWFNKKLLKIKITNKEVNLAKSILQIIDLYVEAKKNAFENFINFLKKSQQLNKKELYNFIKEKLDPNTDARIFEIVSYSILKYYYADWNIYWGFEPKKIIKENLKLYKTGRTNANDGGIDFVMKPLGRFFQVTESLDFKKYFLDIDKINKYPITFVIKSTHSLSEISEKIYKQACKQYTIQKIVDKYMNCIEEIINIPILLEYFNKLLDENKINMVLDEIIIQSKLEFNYE